MSSVPSLTKSASAESPSSSPPPKASRFRFGPRERRDALVFLAFAAPNVLLILAFTYRPVIVNLYYSMLNWTTGAGNATFVGLRNYVEFFTSSDTLDVLRITVVFTVVTVVGSMLLGLLVALVLNRKFAGSGLARAAVFSPYVLSGVGVGLIWLFIFDPVIGVLAAVLRAFGGSSPEWFNDPDLTLVMVIIVYVWKNMGYSAVIYLAGLQAVPGDLLEAASLDGAGKWRTFRSVVWPLLSPTTFFLTITNILASLQAFDIIRIMKPNGIGVSTLIYKAYDVGFNSQSRAGYSATISTVLFVLLVIITLVQLRFAERRVHYS